MTRKMKIIIDTMMTVALLFLMPYGLVGEVAHEWIGIGMFVLVVWHHILNRKWIGNLLKGKYTPLRIVQTILVALVFVSMLGSMLSGILLSRHIFSFLDIRGVASLARKIHMASAYWGFVWMSIHLGIHWSMMIDIAKNMVKRHSVIRKWIVRIVGLMIAGYGAYAFVKRDIGSYMLLKIQFVFFDYEEPLIFFLLDYMAAMGLFIFISYYLSKVLKKAGKLLQKDFI